MSLPIYQVDSFTDRPFAGNPAGVMILPEFPSDQRMLQIAAEMNLAETAFIVPRDGVFDLRWFSPAVEVDLCGHATLASAHILWETQRLPASRGAEFDTRSGRLVAHATPEGIELDLPTLMPQPSTAPDELLAALGVTPVFVGLSKFDYLVQLKSAAEVRSIQVDFRRLSKVGARGAIVTAVSDDPQFDFISRFFAPAVGIDEDPVTGSAHCVLAPFWQSKLGKNNLSAYQASPRGGSLQIRVNPQRTTLIGRAVTVLRGEMIV